MKLIERNRLCARGSGNKLRFRRIIRIAPVPPIAEPQRGQKMQARTLRPAIPSGDSYQDVFEGGFRVLDEHVEVAALVENPRIDQLILGFETCSLLVLNAQLIVWKCRLRILVEVF